MIPSFDSSGLLPAGVHWATWPEVEHRYGTNAYRLRLLDGLARAITALSIAGCCGLYLDGSFVSNKPLPNDYDACWEMVGVDTSLLDPVFLDFRNRRAAQKAKYLGEFFPAHGSAETSPPFRIYLDFFQIDKSTGDSKGIVGIKLNPPS